MNLSILFAPQIRAFGKAAGRQFTRAEVETIETTMNSVASLDQGGNVRFNLGAGPVGTLDDALTMMSVGMGAPVATSTATRSIPVGASATERALAVNAQIRAGADVSNREHAAQIAENSGNPWSPKWANRTRQAIISNKNPQLAERLKREAGVLP